MSRKGVSNQNVGSGSIESTLDAILLLQCFCGDLFEKIGIGMGWSVAFGTERWRWRAGRRRRRRWWSRLNRSQGIIRGPMIGIAPCQIGSYADQMMFGEGQRFCVAAAKERK
jgi:hypothetical protein